MPTLALLNQLNYQEKKKIIICSLATFTLLLAWIIFAPSGSLKLFSVKQELSGIVQENNKLRVENEKLRQEITRLKTDSDYLEQVARERGLLKRDEMVFVFK